LSLQYFKLFFGLRDHRKTRRLQNKTGDNGILGYIWLLGYCKQNKQDGILRDLSEEDILDEARISPENGEKFIDTLIKSKFACKWKDIDKGYRVKWYTYPEFIVPKSEDLVILNWFEHNIELWPPRIREISEKARKAAKARWNKD
jgi:hypothetical protein